MSYYDYDYEIEPNYPEVEEIIKGAESEFSEFLHNTFVEQYKSINSLKEANLNTKKALDDLTRALNEKERKLNERETELSKSEEKQYEKLKNEWFKELGLAFDIGDTAYFCKKVVEHSTCPTCDGKTKVKAKIKDVIDIVFESEIDCPTCKGFGKIKKDSVFEVAEAKVIEIDVNICKDKSGIEIESKDYYGDLYSYAKVRDKSDNYYKLECKDLYKTKEEAESHIAELKGEN